MEPDGGAALLSPNPRPRARRARRCFPPHRDSSGGGLEGRCTWPAEGLPHHGTGEDQTCAAQGRSRSSAQEHQELLCPRALGHCLAAASAPTGRRRWTTLPGRGATLPGCPGAAVTDPARPAGATAPNKRPGGGPETSRGRGRAAPSARGANPSPAAPHGLRPPVPPTRLSPPRRALQRAR